MDLTTYVDRLRQALTDALSPDDPATAAGAERLLRAVDPAVRLTLMEALSDAAAQISAELGEGSVEVRLRGRDVELVVDVPSRTAVEWQQPVDLSSEVTTGDQARLTLRLPQDLKADAEAAAARSGQSLNSWLVTGLRGSVLGSAPLGRGQTTPRHPRVPHSLPGQHLTGWV